MRVSFGLCLALAGLCSACSSVVKYPGAGAWGPDTKSLGPVTADSGKWPLSLNVPPPEQTYYSALKSKACGQYWVPIDEIVLGEVSVALSTEMVGTVRAWKATAMAGQKPAP